MDRIIQFFTDHFGPKFLVGLAITSALATSGVTGAKIFANMNETQSSQEIPEVRVENGTTNPTGDTGSENVSGIHRTTGSTGVSSRFPGRISPTSFPIAPTLTPTPKRTVNANACIITLFGLQYDVAKLRQTHSGGDVFACNTDMSSVYQNRHGTNVSRMQAYLVGSGSSGTSGATGSTGAGTSFSNSDSEDEDHETEQEKQEIEHEEESQTQTSGQEREGSR